MSDTPRTDEACEWIFAHDEDQSPKVMVPSDFARKLEREIVGMRKTLESIRDTAIAMKDAQKINPRSVLLVEGPERIRARACEALRQPKGEE